MNGRKTRHVEGFEKKLKPGETILEFLEGWIGDMMGTGKNRQQNGSLIVTNERLVFFQNGYLFGDIFETIPLSKISSIEQKSFMGHKVITAHTAHDELKFKTFEAASMVESMNAAIERGREAPSAQPPAAVATAATPVAADPIQQLKSLAELRDSGVITAQEFEAKKAQLLAKIG